MKTLLAALAALVVAGGAMAQDAAVPVIDAQDLDTLRSHKDQIATVEGTVMDIGTTQSAGITFLNIGMPKKEGFVAVVFKTSYDAFPDGFDKYRNQKVRVTGQIELYRDVTPQIVLKSPEQITIVSEAE